MILIKNKFLEIINILRASFISLVPYYVLYSTVLLLIEILKHFNLFSSFFTLEESHNLVKLVVGLLPLLVNISISFHLTNSHFTSANRFLTIILSLIIYLCVELIVFGINIEKYILPQSMIFAILIPLVVNFLLSNYLKISKSYQEKLNNSISNNIATMLIYIIPFILIFFLLTFLFSSVSIALDLTSNITIFEEGQETLLLFFRTIISNFLWLLGIHGINFFDTLINIQILDNFISENLTYKEFFNLFVLLGGSGAGLSLLLSIFLFSKDKHTTLIGKMSLPFVIFNINEILIFGIPIFMNFSLIIPFILVPIFNFTLSYIFISYTDIILFNDTFLPWTTPALMNIYLSTDGNIIAILFQLFLIIIGSFIYMPFIKSYTRTQSSTLSLEKTARKFDISLEVESRRDIKFQEAQSSLIKSHHKINKIIDEINQDNLTLYYQPKINIQNKTCNEFEALIRIKDKNGIMRGPDFIIDIEDSGLASIIDIWVCKEVKKDLELWAEKDFYPEISINIFPHTLEDKNYINDIISILKGYNICFEIIERRSSLNKNVFENIKLMKQEGFKISLDDLGVGFTNFSILYEIPLSSVKIDRKIIEYTKDKKGFILYKNICELCSDLNYQIILEGIETQDEYDKLVNPKINIIQGWYYSKAICFDEVYQYSKSF
ncbi:EAL domain-containing protein [Arcobacter peruensis]|uniref:EAL domain-containing protein n=1 Tax=Arcobacter peruensis TaxID=2320140 RepID=UPI000F08A993|nr:EAL domain-containing protein [Arcobacter peruensis]